LVFAQNGNNNFNQANYHFVHDTISLESLGKNYKPGKNVTEDQSKADMGGNTSIRNESEEMLKWKTQGYYQRNRDIGQVFIPKKDTWVESIVFRTGPTENAVLYGTPGAPVFIQFFDITGTPVINNNGTPTGTQSTHGFSTNHRTDDFIEGIEYLSLPSIFVGFFPSEIQATKDENDNILGNIGRLHYIRWKFNEPLFFEANKIYGFIMGFAETGEGYGFTLANVNKAAISDPPSIDDKHTPYKGGWSFRREGDGTLPPSMIPGNNPPSKTDDFLKLKQESLFASGDDRYLLSPTSDGYPDVDTYRALEFYIEEYQSAVNLNAIELPVELTIDINSTYQLQPTFIPENATNKTITWFSSTPTVASIDNTGMITALNVGKTAITTFSKDGNFNAICIVTIVEPTH